MPGDVRPSLVQHLAKRQSDSNSASGTGSASEPSASNPPPSGSQPGSVLPSESNSSQSQSGSSSINPSSSSFFSSSASPSTSFSSSTTSSTESTSSSPLPSSTAPSLPPPQGFLENTAAVASVSAIGGLFAIAFVALIITTCVRRRRVRKFEQDIARANASRASRRPYMSDEELFDEDERMMASSSAGSHSANRAHSHASRAVSRAGSHATSHATSHVTSSGHHATSNPAYGPYHQMPRHAEYSRSGFNTSGTSFNNGAGGYGSRAQPRNQYGMQDLTGAGYDPTAGRYPQPPYRPGPSPAGMAGVGTGNAALRSGAVSPNLGSSSSGSAYESARARHRSQGPSPNASFDQHPTPTPAPVRHTTVYPNQRGPPNGVAPVAPPPFEGKDRYSANPKQASQPRIHSQAPRPPPQIYEPPMSSTSDAYGGMEQDPISPVTPRDQAYGGMLLSTSPQSPGLLSVPSAASHRVSAVSGVGGPGKPRTSGFVGGPPPSVYPAQGVGVAAPRPISVVRDDKDYIKQRPLKVANQ